MLQAGVNAGSFKDFKVVYDEPLVLRRGDDVEDKVWEAIGLRPLDIAILVTVAPSSDLAGIIRLEDIDADTKLWPADIPSLDREAAHEVRRSGHIDLDLLPADLDLVRYA